MKKFSILILLIPIFFSFAKAQNDESIFQPTLKFKGFTQMYFSYAQSVHPDLSSPYGFSIRRLRFKPYGQITEKIDWGFQLSYDRQVLKLLDVYINFKPSASFNIKVGQFAPPAAKSGALADELFSTTKMLLIQRAPITQNWLGNANLYAYRTVGVQLSGKILDKKLYYGVMFSNPKGNGLFTPATKHVIYNHPDNGYALWGRIEFKPVNGIGIGGFAHSGTETNMQTDNIGNIEEVATDRQSYGAHFFMKKSGFRILTEFIGGKIDIEDGDEMKYTGAFFDISYRLKDFAPALRYDFYTPNDGNPDVNHVKSYRNFTIGATYFINKKVKIQANYIVRDEDMEQGVDKIDNDLIFFQLQYAFSGK